MNRLLFALVGVLAGSSSVHAHFHMLIPNTPSAKVGDEITVTYQFGHPFEHEIADAKEPESAMIFLPDGKSIDARKQLRKIELHGEEGRKHVAWRLTYKPEQRGDHVVVFQSPDAALPGEKLPVRDTVKLVVHVQTQNGWDTHAARVKDQPVDLVPLTRPYGLRANMVFRAAFHDLTAKASEGVAPPIAHAEVEIEKYNPAPPKQLPPDEHVTYAARTDASGVVAATLPEPGWWAVTAIKPGPKAIARCTQWVYVDEKAPLQPAK